MRKRMDFEEYKVIWYRDRTVYQDLVARCMKEVEFKERSVRKFKGSLVIDGVKWEWKGEKGRAAMTGNGLGY